MVIAFVFVGLGGFMGANVRYFMTLTINQLFANRFGSSVPIWGTLFVNVTGSLLLALFVSLAARQVTLPEQWRLLIGTGFFGAYTTFSTYAVESIALAQDYGWANALGNILGTNLLCLLGVLVGLALAQRLWT